MRLIGLSGYAQSGKDTAAKVLTEQHGYQRVAFADTLREAVYRLNPFLTDAGGGRWRLQDEVDLHGWEAAKQSIEVRRLLQVMGTEVGRELFGPNVWVDAAFSKLEVGGKYAFTDVRFPNEADRIAAQGGILIRVERPGVEAVNRHPSETALAGYPFNYYVENDSTIESLHAKIGAIVGA